MTKSAYYCTQCKTVFAEPGTKKMVHCYCIHTGRYTTAWWLRELTNEEKKLPETAMQVLLQKQVT